MPKLYSARVVLAALGRAGFIIVSQRGSHIKLTKVVKERTYIVIIPNHKELAQGTFGSILKQANLTKEEFEGFVK